MSSGKKASVKWNIPDEKESKSPLTPQSARSYGDITSEKYLYSDSFEDVSQSHPASETLNSYSYSDTFINETSVPVNTKHKSVGFKATHDKDHSAASDNIHTVISATDRGETSEIYEATNLETAISATDVLQTVIEVDTDVSEFTALDTDVPDTVYDGSELHPADSYSYTDTFESAGRTKGDSQYDASSLVDSYTSTFTGTFTRPSRKWTERSGDDSLDRSFIAPDYDGKSLTDDDEDDDTLNDEYSYTFEPTEISSQIHRVDPEEVQREAELEMLTEVAENDFIYAMVTKLKGKQNKKYMQVLPPDSDDDSEDDYQKHFCKKQLRMMKRQKMGEAEKNINTSQHPLTAGKQADAKVPSQLLERAKLNRVMSAMNKAAKQKIHDPRKCEDCSELKLKLDTEEAERAFVSSRAKTLENRMMDARVEEHLIRMNSISMIAELARELPRPTEKPEKIMDRLFEPLLGKNVMR